jgi:hypothetical protein
MTPAQHLALAKRYRERAKRLWKDSARLRERALRAESKYWAHEAAARAKQKET